MITIGRMTGSIIRIGEVWCIWLYYGFRGIINPCLNHVCGAKGVNGLDMIPNPDRKNYLTAELSTRLISATASRVRL